MKTNQAEIKNQGAYIRRPGLHVQADGTLVYMLAWPPLMYVGRAKRNQPKRNQAR